jgi:hypothetical protein
MELPAPLLEKNVTPERILGTWMLASSTNAAIQTMYASKIHPLLLVALVLIFSLDMNIPRGLSLILKV